MDKLFKDIAELIEKEIDEIAEIKYLDKEMGYNLIICLKDGKQVILSLIEN